MHVAKRRHNILKRKLELIGIELLVLAAERVPLERLRPALGRAREFPEFYAQKASLLARSERSG